MKGLDRLTRIGGAGLADSIAMAFVGSNDTYTQEQALSIS